VVYRLDLSCLSCGYDVGEVEGRRGAPVEELVFLPVHQGDRLIVDERGRFRCPRCKGVILVQSLGPVQHPIDPATNVEGDLREELSSGGRRRSSWP
jgi:hypothetical protein